MLLSSQIKPVSHLKANTATITELTKTRSPMFITQNGTAKIVVQDIHSYEQTQETIALLKVLALGNQEIERGDVMPVEEAFKKLRGKTKSR